MRRQSRIRPFGPNRIPNPGGDGVLALARYRRAASRAGDNADDAIKSDNPALSQKLLIYLVSVMVERLSFASLMIGVLRR
jgi:hypothetical protein